MSEIPPKLTQEEFEQDVKQHLRATEQDLDSKIALLRVFNYILYVLHTSCQWKELPIDPDLTKPGKKEISYHALYYHFRKWSKDGIAYEKVWEQKLQRIEDHLNVSELMLVRRKDH